jgi:hypothetical protein
VEWICSVGGVSGRSELESAYATIREVLIDRSPDAESASIRHIVVRTFEEGAVSMELHVESTHSGADRFGQYVSMLFSRNSVGLWPAGVLSGNVAIYLYRHGAPVGTKSVPAVMLTGAGAGTVLSDVPASEVAYLSPQRFVDRCVGGGME